MTNRRPTPKDMRTALADRHLTTALSEYAALYRVDPQTIRDAIDQSIARQSTGRRV